MKVKVYLIAACLMLGSLSICAQKKPRMIEFEKLSDYVDDWDHRRDGERLIVTDLPSIGKLTLEKRRNLYSFQPGGATDVGSTFFTSPVLARSLQSHLKLGDYLSMFVYCSLIQFVGDQDVYRSPYVTKVEGFDGHGRLAWTVIGPPAAKLKMSQ